MTKAETQYVYAITHLDLPQPHRTVQVAHGIIAAGNAFPFPCHHPHLVVCAVPDEDALAGLFNRLKDAGVPCCAYYEDDRAEELTCVATGPLKGNQRQPLRRLPLLPA